MGASFRQHSAAQDPGSGRMGTQDSEARTTREIDLAGKRIVVLDDALEQSVIDWLDSARHRHYGLSDFDTEGTEYSLHWKSEEEMEETFTRPFIDLAYLVFPDRELRLERCHFNLHLYGDLQFPHTDGPPGSVTALVFANKVWEPKWMGETIFYEAPDEPTIAVAPRPGRVVIFDGDILHRGGVPQRECFQPRLSFALKFRPIS